MINPVYELARSEIRSILARDETSGLRQTLHCQQSFIKFYIKRRNDFTKVGNISIFFPFKSPFVPYRRYIQAHVREKNVNLLLLLLRLVTTGLQAPNLNVPHIHWDFSLGQHFSTSKFLIF